MKKKYAEDESVEDILAAEAKQDQRRKPATVRKPRQAKSLGRPVEDNPRHRPEPITTAAKPPPEPEPPPVIIKDAYPVTYGLPPEPEIDAKDDDREAMRLRPLREAPRVPLVALCQQLVKDHGPLTIDEMIMEIWGSNADTNDTRWLKAQLCKWLTAAAKESGEQFYPKRHRNPLRPNTRLNRWGFWTEQQPPDRRYVTHNTEVLTAIAELKTELVTLRQVQSELLQRQNLLKEGFAAMMEKLTWNSEV